MQNAGLIREVRGVMTRFEPLTEEIVAACTQDGLTYAELSDALSVYGLSIEKVVHDPTRKIFNTCYADYDLGLYADIILQREFIRGPGQAQFQKLARQGGICRTLAEQDWRGFYLKDVPLSMLIYDFQRRYKTIPHETVFSVWHGIYKRIDYANGMWSLPVLREVFRYAPPPRLPALEPDGLITIYRGMGALSLPPEQAISWTTHPGNALWFAIHSGQGTKVAVARVRPEQIVAHYPSYAEENEDRGEPNRHRHLLAVSVGRRFRQADHHGQPQGTEARLKILPFPQAGRLRPRLFHRPALGTPGL